MLRNSFLILALAAVWQALAGQSHVGGGMQILHLVDSTHRPLTIGPDAVQVQAYLLDSTRGEPIRPFSLLPETGAAASGQGRPAAISLRPLSVDARGLSSHTHLRLVLSYEADTMVLDLIDVALQDSSGIVDVLDTLAFLPGHMVARRDPARACPKLWHHMRKREQARTRTLLRSGLHAGTLAALTSQGLLAFTPAVPASAPPHDSLPGIELLGTVSDIMVLRLHGWLMTDGACHGGQVWVGLQRWDSAWQDIMPFTQMDCGPSTRWCADVPTALRISTYQIDAMGIQRVLPAGRYRAVVLDRQGRALCTEAVAYDGHPILPPHGGHYFHELCPPWVVLSPSSIHLLPGEPPQRIGTTDTYFFRDCTPKSAPDIARFVLPIYLYQALATHGLVIRGRPFTGCMVLAVQGMELNGRLSHRHILKRQYYFCGKLVGRDEVNGFNLETGAQEDVH